MPGSSPVGTVVIGAGLAPPALEIVGEVGDDAGPEPDPPEHAPITTSAEAAPPNKRMRRETVVEVVSWKGYFLIQDRLTLTMP